MTDGDLLLHRHLDGTLDDGEARDLAARLRSDPALCRRLAEMAVDHVQLLESLREESLPIPVARPPRERSGWSRGSLAAAASILIAVAIALVIGLRPRNPVAPPAPVVPAAPRKTPRTDVTVTCRILKMGDGMIATVEVLAPPELAGQKIRVVPGRKPNGDGELQQDRDHLAFFRKLQPKQEVAFQLRRQDSGEYAIDRLTPEQIEWANQKIEKKKSDARKDGDKEK